jgi:hypothetical protein
MARFVVRLLSVCYRSVITVQFRNLHYLHI